MRFTNWALAPLTMMVFVTGCSVGPDYIVPEVREPSTWIEEQSPRVDAGSTDADSKEVGQEFLDTWWTLFDDPILHTLIDHASQQNLPLQIAGIRILEARAQLAIAIGGLYPQTQQLGAVLSRTSRSENQSNTTTEFDMHHGDLSAGIDAAWEIDLWGKFRRAIQADLSGLEASVANYDDLLVSLTAEVGSTYVQIRTLEKRREIALENVKIQKESLKISQVRFNEGDVTNLDVQQAKALLKDTEASVPRIEARLRQAKNALGILLGLLPGEVDSMLESPQRDVPKAPTQVAVGIPAELLRRRPDIRLAERQLASQSALIGVAKADLYPHFSLFGSIGLVSSDSEVTAASPSGSSYSDLWESDSVEFFGGPQLSWDLLNYGRIKNRVRVQDARFQQLAVNYQDTVLEAAREAEDSMAAFLRSEEEAKFLSESVAAAKKSVELSMIQYREGLVDFQRVLDTQRFQAQQQDAETQVFGAVATNLIATYKALGGGWRFRDGQQIISPEIREEMQNRTDWGGLLSEEELEGLNADQAGEQSAWPDW